MKSPPVKPRPPTIGQESPKEPYPEDEDIYAEILDDYVTIAADARLSTTTTGQPHLQTDLDDSRRPDGQAQVPGNSSEKLQKPVETAPPQIPEYLELSFYSVYEEPISKSQSKTLNRKSIDV
jgi:hypothetical protein